VSQVAAGWVEPFTRTVGRPDGTAKIVFDAAATGKEIRAALAPVSGRSEEFNRSNTVLVNRLVLCRNGG
jgi:hypothetical protein